MMARPTNAEPTHYDALIVGAGVAGLYALHRLRGLGFKVRVLEAAKDLGGTWYWNRYPGARCDVPSIEYSYSFSDELQQEWNWSESMAGQPEILEYLRHVAERFDLRCDIEFNCNVERATYDENAKHWLLTTADGATLSSNHCIMATGCLSVPNQPKLKGAELFKGEVYHTALWPESKVDFAFKKVGIIGTGSSAVQAIPVIAETAGHLHVFQRTPGYTFPANNQPLDPDYLKKVKSDYKEIRQLQRESVGGFSGYPQVNKPTKPLKSIKEATSQEINELFDRKGFGVFQSFSDVYTDLDANSIACNLYAEYVRKVVEDPRVAEALIPHDYPLGCKRQVLDTDYYPAFNRDNVDLVNVNADPIQQVTASGIQTAKATYDLDMIIYATGFDAMTGALKRIDIRGRNGNSLKDKWSDGPRSYLGLQVHGFPNLFTVTGPGSPSVLSNMMVAIEQHVDWISDCLVHLRSQGISSIEADEMEENHWVGEVNRAAEHTMLTAPNCNSWYLGANIPGKPRIFMPYVGGFNRYARKCAAIAADGYRHFHLN